MLSDLASDSGGPDIFDDPPSADTPNTVSKPTVQEFNIKTFAACPLSAGGIQASYLDKYLGDMLQVVSTVKESLQAKTADAKEQS